MHAGFGERAGETGLTKARTVPGSTEGGSVKVRRVAFEGDRVIVTVSLGRGRLVCPLRLERNRFSLALNRSRTFL